MSETIDGKDLAIVGKDFSEKIWPLPDTIVGKDLPLSEKIVGKDLVIVGKERKRCGHCWKMAEAIWSLSENIVGKDLTIIGND